MSRIKVESIRHPDATADSINLDLNGNVNIDSNTLYVDATNNRVGIGNNTSGFASNLIIGSGSGNNGATIFAGTASSSYLHFADGTSGSDRFRGYIDYDHSNNSFSFATNDSTAVTIDSSQRLLVGTSTSRTSIFGDPARFQVEGNAYQDGAGSFIVNSNTEYGPSISFGKSRGTSSSSFTAVTTDDRLGLLEFFGANGSALNTAARIECRVDGAVSGGGANDMPGRLVLSTTADGQSSPTERLRLTRTGDHVIYNSSYVYPSADNVTQLGLNGGRWSSVWAANGTIQTSDQRAKTEISTAQLGSDFIKSLRPVSYKWIEGGKHHTGEYDEDNNWIYESVPGTRTHWGFIAQEVKQAVDAAGVDFGGWVLTDKDDPDSQQALRYDQFIAPLTKALQETMAELESLKAEVAALKAS